MPVRDPFKMYKGRQRFPTMRWVDQNVTKQPYLGISTGGSSRENSPAKVAATLARAPSKNGERNGSA